MRRELLIAAGPGEWRAAWLEDGVAVELHVERGNTAPPGTIVLGRVQEIARGLDAAFVDIGEPREGFLPGRPLPEEGAAIIVEVQREAQRGKGARLSTRIAPDRFAALPGRAAGRDPPARLDPAAEFAGSLALRLPDVPDRVLVDEAAPLAQLRQAFPRADIARQEAADWPADIENLFAAALSPVVALPGGGALHVAEEEAATLVDVDTGSPETGSLARNVLTANLEAAALVARQIRLRQIGGGIVVDFAALEGRGPRERVRLALVEALAGDPARPQVLGWTRLGHLEIVRTRRLRSLADVMLEPGATRKSADTLAFEALRVLAQEARAAPAADWRLVARDDIAAVLAQAGPVASALRMLEERLRRKIAVVTRPQNPDRPFDIVRL